MNVVAIAPETGPLPAAQPQSAWVLATRAWEAEHPGSRLLPSALVDLAEAMVQAPDASAQDATFTVASLAQRGRAPRRAWGVFRRESMDDRTDPSGLSGLPSPSIEPVKARLCHTALAEELTAATALTEREILQVGTQVQSIYQDCAQHADALKHVRTQFSEGQSDGGRSTFGRVVAEQSSSLASYPAAFEQVMARVEAQQAIANRAGEHASRILGLATSIDQITATVNILGINALISVSQAGEHGAGFSVVARELRKLAARTKEANEAIAEMAREVGASLPRLMASNAEVATLCRTKSQELKGVVADASARLRSTYQDVQASLLNAIEEASARSVAISESCNTVLSHLMFQDRVAQHLISATRIADTWLAPTRHSEAELPAEIDRLRIGTERLARSRGGESVAVSNQDINDAGEISFL